MMNRLLFFLIFNYAFSASAMDQSYLQWIKNAGFSQNDFSVLILPDRGGKEVRWKEGESRIPASLSKYIVAGMAFHFLPKDYKWETKLFSEKPIESEEYKGDICLYGGGNPHFLTEQSWILANRLLRTGIKSFTGNLLVDETSFDSDYFSDTRMSKRTLRAYDSPVSGASFNWNSVNLFVRPGKVGEPAKVYLFPNPDYIEVKNQLKTHKGKTSVRVERIVGKDSETFVLKGKVSHLLDEKAYYRPIQRVGQWTGSNVLKVFERAGVKVNASVKTGNCSAFKTELAGVEGKDVSSAVQDMMKYSNNFIAEMLSKTIVMHETGAKGSLDSLGPFVDLYLKKAMKLKKNESYVFKSVSGLSYENRFTPDQLYRLLNHEKENFGSFPEFASSLPISGVDGTLKSRLKGVSKERLRAKTGLLNGVVSLAGYGQTKKKTEFQYVLIYNGPKNTAAWKVQQIFDKILDDYVQRF